MRNTSCYIDVSLFWYAGVLAGAYAASKLNGIGNSFDFSSSFWWDEKFRFSILLWYSGHKSAAAFHFISTAFSKRVHFKQYFYKYDISIIIEPDTTSSC